MLNLEPGLAMATRCSDVHLNDRGAHTFTDMSREPKPDSSEVVEDDREVFAPKRGRTDGQEEADVDIEGDDDNGHLDETAPQGNSGSIDEAEAQTGSQSVGPNDVGNVSGLESILNDAVPDNINTMTGYGPPRQDRSLHTRATSSATPVANMTPVDPNTPLQAALQRAHELLDTGNIRAVRGQFGVPGPFTRTENTEDNGKEHDAFLCSEITDDERNMEYFETFMAQSMHEEIQMKDMTEHEHEHLHRGQEEWQKLLKTNSVKIISGREATRIKEEKKDRILKSRYVKTQKPDPLFPDETIIKHRWVIKGYLDPDLELLQDDWHVRNIETLQSYCQTSEACRAPSNSVRHKALGSTHHSYARCLKCDTVVFEVCACT